MGIIIEELRVDDLHENPHNPRTQVGDVGELAASIRMQGIKQPLLVTPTGEMDIDGHERYRVVIGHRRLAAAKQAGLRTVPAIVEDMDARREREIMLVENTQRSDLTPIEEADGYQGLLDLGVQVKEMAAKTGRSDRFVRQRLKIARIPQSTRDMAKDFGQLTLDQLDRLAEFESDPTMQQELARSDDFDWTYQRLKHERTRTEWYAKALKALANAGVDVEELPNGRDYWTWAPDGYVAARIITQSGGDFWKAFTAERDWPDLRVYARDRDICTYRRIPQDELDRKHAQADEAKERKAQARKLDAMARSFDETARATRVAWLKDNLPSLTAKTREDGIHALAHAEFVGWRTTLPYTSPNSEKVIGNLIAFGWKLPITETDDEHYWTLDCKENLEAMRGLLKTHPARILDVMVARQEALITQSSWRGRYRLDSTGFYYGILERLGYRPSEQERLALAGAYLDKEEGESS